MSGYACPERSKAQSKGAKSKGFAHLTCAAERRSAGAPPTASAVAWRLGFCDSPLQGGVIMGAHPVAFPMDNHGGLSLHNTFSHSIGKGCRKFTDV